MLIIFLVLGLAALTAGSKGEVRWFGGGAERKIEVEQTERMTRLMFGGDVMLGRSVMIEALEKKGDARYPFLKIGERLRDADLAMVNLENPVISDCPRYEHGFIFCSIPVMLEGLNWSGVDIVNLANNHTQNFGKEGLEETKKYLAKDGIEWVGDGNLVVKEVNGTRFGFLGFDFVSNVLSEDDWEKIAKAAGEVDVLIVNVHWGWEYQAESNANQKEWGRKMIDLGAKLVIGHHPHWTQEVEEYKDGVIYYSLGNLVFDQMWSEETRKGEVVEVDFVGKEIVNRAVWPTYIENWGQPEFVN